MPLLTARSFGPMGRMPPSLVSLFTVLGQFAGVGLLALFGSPVMAIPSVIPLFFGGCTLGVFANAWGGWKGVIGATFIMGIITICGSAALAYVVGTNFVSRPFRLEHIMVGCNVYLADSVWSKGLSWSKG